MINKAFGITTPSYPSLYPSQEKRVVLLGKTETEIYSQAKSRFPLSRLRIHPTQEWYDIYQPETNDDLQRSLGHYLLGMDNGWGKNPPIRLSLHRYNGPPVSFRAEDSYPPRRTKYQTMYLGSASGKLQMDMPVADTITAYQSDSWEDDGAYFFYTFSKYTELCGFPRPLFTYPVMMTTWTST